MSNLYAFAIGLARTDANNDPLDCYFPLPLKAPGAELAKLITGQFEAGTQSADVDAVRRFLDSGGVLLRN